jgi:hypothetical protein
MTRTFWNAMTTRATIVLIVVGLSAARVGIAEGAATPNSRFETTTVCASPDPYATQIRDYLVSFVAGTDSASAASRVMWDLPQVADTSVAFVSDSTACELAARGHTRATQSDTVNVSPVFVIRIGTARYVVFNLTRTGEFLTYVVLDALYKERKTVIS